MNASPDSQRLRLLAHRLRLAVDLTLIPYHGQPESDPKEVYRSKAKAGTSHFLGQN